MAIPILRNSLHMVSSALLSPVIIVLLLFICLTIMAVGSILGEGIFERCRTKVNMVEYLRQIQGGDLEKIESFIVSSKFLARHKRILLILLENRYLDAPVGHALANQLIAEQGLRGKKILTFTDVIVRLAPMLGLMGTLIPLGPGMIALGQGDTKVLAESLLVGFDTTIAGLATGGISFVISRLRRNWYEKDMTALETLTEGLLGVMYDDKISDEKQ